MNKINIDISTLQIKEGDIIVVKFDADLFDSDDFLKQLRSSLSEVFPNDKFNGIFLDKNIDISTISEEEMHKMGWVKIEQNKTS